MGYHVLLLGISQTQGSNPSLVCLLHWQVGSLPLGPPGKPQAPLSCLFLNNICHFLIYAAKSRQSCLTLCNPIDGSPSCSCPWDSPGKNPGVGCLFLLQCMKVKSESEVTQLCPTLRDLMDCSLPRSSVHGISQAGVLEWVAIAFFFLIYRIYLFSLYLSIIVCLSPTHIRM